VIDGKDINLIQTIIDNGLDWKTDYPFADANYDGNVNSDDIAYVQKIMNASADNQVTVYHYNENPSGYYVVDTKYPITSALSSSAQTTIIMLKTLGIVSEIKGTSFTYTDQSMYDQYVFGDYFDVMTEGCRISSKSVGVDVDTASNFVTEYGCSAYVYSSSSSTLTNASTIEGAGIDLIQVADGMSDVGDYTSAVLLIGFLFGTSVNEYQETAIKFADWINDYYNDLQEHLESVYDGTVEQVSGIASTMTQYVAVKGSSNVDVIEGAGLSCPVADTVSVGSTSLKYVGGTDTWLNYMDVGVLVALRGSSDGWSWFDKDYTTCPDYFANLLNNFSSLQCCQNGNAIVVSTMMPAPLKSGIIAEYAYSNLFDDGWAESYLADFYMTFWGWSEEQCDGLQYYMTQEEVLGS